MKKNKVKGDNERERKKREIEREGGRHSVRIAK